MTAPRRATVVAAIDAAIALARASAPIGGELVAIGWSTVDLERAERELGIAAVDVPADAWLGARCRVASDAFDVPLVLLEPSTEGRLAGSLARLGEGFVAAWYAPVASAPTTVARASAGPFGPERVLPVDPADGRFRFLMMTRTGTMPP